METKDLSKIKIALLGHGPFARPIFEEVEKHFTISSAENSDAYLVANYGKIIPFAEINQLRFGAINVHGSILPKYRGASPIQTALANGDKTTGITIILIDEKVDHGPVLAKKEIKINPDDTTEDLYPKLGNLAGKIIVPTLRQLFSGKIVPVEQDHLQATFTTKIKSPVVLLPTDNHQKLFNHYQAYFREPGFFIDLGQSGQLKIIQAKLERKKFVPLIVQKPGKKPLPYRIFLQGFRGADPFV